MREYLYRGMTVKGTWILGYYARCEDDHYIYCHESICIDPEENYFENQLVSYKVKPETVGQYTGLKDKNGVKVFEGDIVRALNVYGYIFEYTVEWNQNLLSWCCKGEGQIFDIKYCEITGNIHEAKG